MRYAPALPLGQVADTVTGHTEPSAVAKMAGVSRPKLWLIITGAAVLLAAAVAVPVIALAQAAADYNAPAGANTPTLADWMQAWGSIAAVVAGLLAALAAAALLAHEMRQAREARQEAADEREKTRQEVERAELVRLDAEKLHARMVAYGDVMIAGPPEAIRRVFLTFGNYGPGPILDARVTLVGDGPLAGKLEEVVLTKGILAQREAIRVDRVLERQPLTGGLDEATLVAALSIEARFTDMHGRKWLRRDNGEPEQILSET